MRYAQQMQRARKQIVSAYRRAFVVFVSCALFSVCGPLSAQTSDTGAISGAITDTTAAVLAGADIKVTDVATGSTRTAQTNGQGQYRITLLQPGQYRLEVSKQGFKSAASSDIQVVVAETTVQNVRMEIGTVSETVVVASSNVDLETE